MATSKKTPTRVNAGKTCKTKGCEKDAYCKGMCVACYSKARRQEQ